MPEILAPRRNEMLTLAALTTLAVGGLYLLRAEKVRRVNGAERLADALLDTERLRNATENLTEMSEKALAACAGYLVNVAYRAAEGFSSASGAEDPVGYSRTHTHPYTHAASTVLTEAVVPVSCLTYAVHIPEVGEVRGTRQIGSIRVAGLSPARPVPDRVQISLGESYTAQLETEFEVADYPLTGRTRLFGSADLRDSLGNFGHINIAHDGTITGTVTREARVIGRFEGQVASGLSFRQNIIESGPA